MDKATERGRQWFSQLLPADADVTQRPMFGNLAGFVNGNMFVCLYGDYVAVRLGERERAELVGEGGSPFEPMPGRPMKEYVVLPESFRDEPERATGWVDRSLAHVRAMPPKKKSPPRRKQ